MPKPRTPKVVRLIRRERKAIIYHHIPDWAKASGWAELAEMVDIDTPLTKGLIGEVIAREKARTFTSTGHPTPNT